MEDFFDEMKQEQNNPVAKETEELMIEIQENINDAPVPVSIDVNSVVESMPPLMNKCLSVLEGQEERKMGLYALTVLTGALMPQVWFNYDSKINYPGLMVQISYPPAAGKGKLALLPKLLGRINKELLASNAVALKKYTAEQKNYERLVRRGEEGNPPQRPNLRLLLVPGNTTSAMLTEQLADNNGDMMLLLFETETDALTNIMKGPFGGDNSMTFRKAYHNEPVSQMRKNNREHFDIQNPKMAVVLSGTDSQVEKLFQSNADGLFSRFLIVQGRTPTVWRDVQPCDACTPLDHHFDKLGEQWYDMFIFFRERSVEVKFSNDQWKEINSFGEEKQTESMEEGGENAISIARRHTLMICRIAVVFTMVRYFEQKQTADMVYCTDLDFQNALWMVNQSYKCSMELFISLGSKVNKAENVLDDYFDLLPDKFLTRELAPLRAKLDIREKTQERRIGALVNKGRLTKLKKGHFQKVTVTDLSVDGSK